MKIISLPENVAAADLAERILQIKPTPTEEKATLSQLLAANPQLRDLKSVPAGTTIVVPDGVDTGMSALTAPSQRASLAMLQQLQAALPDISQSIAKAYAEDKISQRKSQEAMIDALGSDPSIATKAALAKKIKAIETRTKALALEAEANHQVQKELVSQVKRDLTVFMKQHDPAPKR